MNIHGWVTFPIPFTKLRRLVTNHQGQVFMDSKAQESNTLSGFTLDVRDNKDSSEDAQWIAIGARYSGEIHGQGIQKCLIGIFR